MKAEIKDGNLIITIPVNDPPYESNSGKTLIVASSGDNQKPGITVQGKPLFVGINAYIKKD